MAEDRTYRLEPMDTSGVFLGLGVSQSAILGAGIVVAVVTFTVGVPVLLAVVPVVGAVAVCFGRVGGHHAWEWLGLGARWGWTTTTGRRRWRARLPLWPVDADQAAPLPPCLDGLEVTPVPWRAMTDIAAIADPSAGTLTAVVPVAAGQFPLAARGDQERLVAGWGDLLSHFAGAQTPVAHLAWSDIVRPAGLVDHRRWLEGRRSDSTAPAAASYDELLHVAAGAAAERDVVVTITVDRSKLGRRHQPAGDGDPLHRALISAVESLLRGLRAADLQAGDPLGPAGLHRLLRVRADPSVTTAGLRTGRLADRLGLISAASAAPLAVDVAWRHVQVDAAWHRTYWIAGWPRLALPSCWLEPFLAAQGVTRSMTVTFAPIPTHQSRRRIERDLVKLQSDAAIKEQRGRRVDARHTRATHTLLEREQELVTGFAEVAYIGLVTITATTQQQLDQHAEITEQHTAEAGMELRVLDGRQDLAWAAALPLGLAPRHLLAS